MARTPAGSFRRWPEATGTVTAIDATSGKVAWQKTFPEPCYAGTATTAGNLVFVCRNAGQLQAYDTTSGKLLWSFQTGAGANNTSTIFQQDGKEYVAFVSGGNSLAATPHGDSLGLFGLDGTLGPAPTTGPGTGTQHAARAAARRTPPARAMPRRASPCLQVTACRATARPGRAATAAPT